MSYDPSNKIPISENIKVTHIVAEPTEPEFKGCKPMGGNVGGKNPRMLEGIKTSQRGTTRAQ